MKKNQHVASRQVLVRAILQPTNQPTNHEGGDGSPRKPHSEGGICHSLNMMRNRTTQTTGMRAPGRMNNMCKNPRAGKCEKQLGRPQNK